MEKLIQTSEASIIYGDFKGEPNQELFRCPRELDNVDLPRYINESRTLVCPMESDVPFENDVETTDLRNIEGKTLIGYYRMYYRNGWGWDGRWMLENGKPSRLDCFGVQQIIDWICEKFDKGCDYYMKDWCAERYVQWGGEHRYLIRPFLSEYYKVMIDTTYGNGDYPVRIYVYKEEEK